MLWLWFLALSKFPSLLEQLLPKQSNLLMTLSLNSSHAKSYIMSLLDTIRVYFYISLLSLFPFYHDLYTILCFHRLSHLIWTPHTFIAQELNKCYNLVEHELSGLWYEVRNKIHLFIIEVLYTVWLLRMINRLIILIENSFVILWYTDT